MPKNLSRILLLLVCLTCTAGCSLGYYLHGAKGQAALMSRRVPIDKVLADPATPAELRKRLRRISQARDFASERLGLPDKKGYRSYADLERPYAVWSVAATAEFSLQPKTWCFPVSGCVSYRGYFSEEKALRFAHQLESRGLDVAVRGVAAYSTLGYFDDPVLNTMMRWDDTQLVAIVFHELAHQLFYVKGDTPFNESFASVVEEAGMQRWAESLAEPEELHAYTARRASEACFIQLIEVARGQLSDLYESGQSQAQMRKNKQEIFASLVNRYESARDAGQIGRGYDAWFAQELNNAHLAAVGVYHRWVPALRALLKQSDGDLQRFYAAARGLAELTTEARAQALAQLEDG